MSTGPSTPVARTERSNAAARLALVGGVPAGSGGVNPNPAMSNTMSLRDAPKYGITLCQADPDIPMPWRRIRGRPDPLSV
jgi:hypothetical protein